MSERKEVALPELRTPERAAMLIAAQDAQIAALTAQVEELRGLLYEHEAGTELREYAKVYDRWKKAEAELATALEAYTEIGTRFADYRAKHAPKLAELSSLREGEKVMYRAEWSFNSTPAIRNQSEFDSMNELRGSLWSVVIHRISEVITRERILDAMGGEG